MDELLGRHHGYITLDIEVGVDKDSSFTHPDSLLCVGIGFAPNRVIVIGEEALHSQRVLDKLGQLLDEKQVICQNGKFDIQVLMRLGVVKHAKLWADTMLASYCLDERPGHHSLEGLSSEILGAPAWKAELKPHLGKGKNKNYANVPRPILYRYNAYDVACTYNLWHEHFEKDLEKTGLRGLHDFLVEASNQLIYLELEGVAIDTEYLDVIDSEYEILLGTLEEGLKGWVDNPRSPQQVLAAAKSMRLPVKASVDAPTLRAILERNLNIEQREFISKILEYRREHKLYGTYIKGTRKRLIENRLYPTFLLHGTVTGRLSCRNPNLQNIPRGSVIKRLFGVDHDNVLIQADYKQAEWRAIACLAQDSYLQGALGDPNRDIHGEVARQFFGPNYTKEQRVMAKTFVFGVAYGRGPDAISKAFKVSVYEAERYIREFFGMIPDVVKWRKDVHEKLFKGGQSLQTPFGRKRRFWLVTRENKHDIEKEALAFLPQSIASDLTLSSLVRMRKYFETNMAEAKIRITVHDSIIAEAPIEYQTDVAKAMKDIMENTAAEVFSDFVPFPVDIEAGYNWADLKVL
jgi:DNA polymerase-1